MGASRLGRRALLAGALAAAARPAWAAGVDLSQADRLVFEAINSNASCLCLQSGFSLIRSSTNLYGPGFDLYAQPAGFAAVVALVTQGNHALPGGWPAPRYPMPPYICMFLKNSIKRPVSLPLATFPLSQQRFEAALSLALSHALPPHVWE